MPRDIIANIVNLRKSINQARLQKQKDCIFTPVLENEQIVLNLSNLSCQNELDFQKAAEMVYKLVVESSGGGKRFPADSRIEAMLSSVRELRNHFLHAREHGEEDEVRKKYRKVGEVYYRLIGKKVPLDNDWESAKVGLFKLVEDGLERAFEIVSQDTAVTIPYFKDNSIEVFDGGKVTSFQSRKRRGLYTLSDIPVFIPQFTIHSPLPNIGVNSCVYATSRPPCNASITQFSDFLKEIENKWKQAPYLLAKYGPFNWSISDDGHFAFGCGAENLTQELLKHKRVAIGGIMQGCYGEDYSRTCFLVVSGYRKGDIVRDICADLYLSCIPTDWNNFNSLFKAFGLIQNSPVIIENFSLMPLTYFSWETKKVKRVKIEILGGLGREGYGHDNSDRETDVYSGILIKAKSFAHLNFQCTENSFDSDDVSMEHLNPIYQLKDVVANITNTIPSCDEVGSGLIVDVFAPRISKLMFDAYGTTIHAISINCTSPRIKASE